MLNSTAQTTVCDIGGLPTRVLPVSAAIATRNRPAPLARMLTSLATQSTQPTEIIIVDASDNEQTAMVCANPPDQLASTINYERAAERGAATQRNQAVEKSSQSIVWFMDDDIVFEPECIARLYAALVSDKHIGGASATIINQGYQQPGRVSCTLYRLLSGEGTTNWAGRVVGPAVNFLPEDNGALPEVVPVEWLNTTCTMYRREALPSPPFPDHFQGYSLMEDVALSLMIGRNWKLANARTARIQHLSESGDHKSDPAAVAEMQLLNRHFVMKNILGRRRLRDYTGLLAFEAVSILSQLRSSKSRRQLLPALRGRLRATRKLLFGIQY
ncbi:MAG: glycosyltransferase family 2 protein [Pirellulales bacterium]